MKISKKLFISAVACAFALGTRAQTNDGYVYVTDVLNKENLTWRDTYFGSLQTENATYATTLYPGSASVLFDSSVPNDGVVVIASNHILGKITIEWNESQQNIAGFKSSLKFITSNEAFKKTKDLHALADEFFTKVNYPDNIYVPKGNYCFWGIKTGENTSNVKNINVYWHITYMRENLTVGNLGTICLPYDVKAEDWADELTAYTIAGKVMNSTREQVEALVFEEVDEMKAGVAYLFVPKKSGICLKYYGTEVQQPVESKYGLIGSFENYTFTEDDCRDNNLFLISNNSIRLAGAGAGVGANRAYIKMSKEMPEYHETNSSRKLLVSANGYIETGDSPTIVEMLKAIASLKDGQNQTSTAYDLQGRMVSGTSAKGIVIENGKKKYISVR